MKERASLEVGLLGFLLGLVALGCASSPDSSTADPPSSADSSASLDNAFVRGRVGAGSPRWPSSPAHPDRVTEDQTPAPDAVPVAPALIAAPEVAGDGIWAGPNQMCLLSEGGAKCFGSNLLGAPTGEHSYDRGLEASDMGANLPAVDLDAGCGVRSVAAGAYHACALLEDGDVKCWGDNRYGELGLGDTNNRTAGARELGRRLERVDLGRGQRARSITAGLGFSCALLECGKVKCWGDNSFGALGLGDTQNRGDQPGEMGNALPAVDLGRGRTAKAIAAGHSHVCAILDNNALKCWGLNAWGQLGQGDVRTRGGATGDMGDALPAIDLGSGHHAKSVAVGPHETCAVLENNTLKCWGFNAYGNLGQGDTLARGDAPGELGDHLPSVSLGSYRTVRDVVMGGGFTCAVLDDHSLKCWGDNANGTLGLGDRERRGDGPGEMGDALPAVDVGHGRAVKRALATYYNACAELDNGRLKCWGSSATGMLGIGRTGMRGDEPGEMGDQLPSFDLGSCSIKAFAGGFPYHFGCAVLSTGSVKCWGANSFGQLGVDRSSHTGDEPGDMGSELRAVSLGTGRTVKTIAPGNYHSCALLDDGSVKCWGANLSGALGQGDTVRRDGRASYMGDNLPTVDLGLGHTAIALAVGSEHSCALLEDGSVKCWGDNSKGELGLGDTNDRGDAHGETGDGLAAVDLGPGAKAKALSLGYRHSCALLEDDHVKCWGWNLYGQLGIEVTDDRGDNTDEMGGNLPFAKIGSKKPAAVYAGYSNTCVLFEDGTLKCWGSNGYGELGLGDTVNRGAYPGSMSLPDLDLGSGRKVLKVGIGAQRMCALLDDQTLKCWGHGSYGALGYGDTNNRGDNPGEMGDALPAVDLGASEHVRNLATSWYGSCAQLTSGIKCWGLNQQGQLGLGDTADVGGALGQMGESLRFVDLP